MIKQLTLYSTSHCHLCESAHALLVPSIGDYSLEIMDIANDEALLTQYGLRIPVLFRHDTNTDLNWPFTSADIQAFLS